jgi:hypothetical protein
VGLSDCELIRIHPMEVCNFFHFLPLTDHGVRYQRCTGGPGSAVAPLGRMDYQTRQISELRPRPPGAPAFVSLLTDGGDVQIRTGAAVVPVVPEGCSDCLSARF